MKYFLCRLLPPRPSFTQDMAAAEAKAMQEHVAYWTALAERGTAIVFGPVADPAGGWGVGIMQVADDDEIRRLTEGDPAIKAGIGLRYEVLPMPRAVIGKRPA